MVCLIPIFLKKNEIFWRSEVASELLNRVLNTAIHASKISRVIVCTNETTILDIISPLKIDSFLLQFDCEKDPDEIIPPGTSGAVTYLIDSLRLNIEDLLILSYKNPLISSEFIDHTIEQYHISTVPLVISGSRAVDHPCQLSTYYKTQDTGCIHMFDHKYDIVPNLLTRLNSLVSNLLNNDQNRTMRCPSRKSATFTATKPFYHDWSAKKVISKSDVNTYFKTYHSGTVNYVPIEDIGKSNHISAVSIYWIFESNYRARIIFNNEVFKSIRQSDNDNFLKLYGVSFDESANQVSMALYGTQDATLFYLRCFHKLHESFSYLVKTVSVDSKIPPSQTVKPDIHFNKANHLLPYPCQGNNLSCIIYSLFKISEDDTYDFSEQLSAPAELWFDTGTHLKINAKTGSAIMGRQDFPDVVEIDKTLIILKKDMLSSLKHNIAKGNAEFIFLPDNCSIQINSYLDVLKYQALLKGNQKRQELPIGGEN